MELLERGYGQRSVKRIVVGLAMIFWFSFISLSNKKGSVNLNVN